MNAKYFSVSGISGLSLIFSVRQYAIARCYRPSVRLSDSDCHTGGSVKNGFMQLSPQSIPMTRGIFLAIWVATSSETLEKTSSITWRYATLCWPVIDCEMNDLE